MMKLKKLNPLWKSKEKKRNKFDEIVENTIKMLDEIFSTYNEIKHAIFILECAKYINRFKS